MRRSEFDGERHGECYGKCVRVCAYIYMKMKPIESTHTVINMINMITHCVYKLNVKLLSIYQLKFAHFTRRIMHTEMVIMSCILVFSRFQSTFHLTYTHQRERAIDGFVC